MSALLKPRHTLEEYFALERASDERYEYFDGEVFCMSGVHPTHSRLGIRLARLLGVAEERGCHLFDADLRVRVPTLPPYRYPDLSALCGNPVIEKLVNQEMLVNPSLIVEILSDSTAEFDRGYKFTYYKSIESFTEYILIAQDRPHISQFVKQAENAWVNHEFNDINDIFQLASLECELTLAEIYENVEFPPIQDRLRIIE